MHKGLKGKSFDLTVIKHSDPHKRITAVKLLSSSYKEYEKKNLTTNICVSFLNNVQARQNPPSVSLSTQLTVFLNFVYELSIS